MQCNNVVIFQCTTESIRLDTVDGWNHAPPKMLKTLHTPENYWPGSQKVKARKILVSHDAAHDGCHVHRPCFDAIVRRHNLTLDVVCRNPAVIHWHCSAKSSLCHRQVPTGLAWTRWCRVCNAEASDGSAADSRCKAVGHPPNMWQIEPLPLLSKWCRTRNCNPTTSKQT